MSLQKFRNQVQKNSQVIPDIITADELTLYANNDEYLYKKQMAWIKNYATKMVKGIYNEELALMGIINNYVPIVINAYKKEFGLGTVDFKTKYWIGQNLLDFIKDGAKWQIDNGFIGKRGEELK